MENKQLRILHVTGSMNVGGTEMMIMNIYRKINKKNIQFDFVLHTNEECYFENEIRSLGGRIFKCPKYYIYNYCSYKKWWKKFFANHKEYNVLHGHICSSAPVYINIAKENGLFTILHTHSTKINKMDLRSFLWTINNYQNRFIANYYLACSKQAGIDHFGKKIVNSDIFNILNNGIDLDKFAFSIEKRNKIRKKYNIMNKIVVGNVARFYEPKNHLFLLDVFNELLKINNNVVLLLVGDGILREKIEKKVKIMGIEKYVIFTGVQNNTEDFYSAMDCFCFPSLYEGLGISLIEAQASMLMCFVSDAIQEEADMKMGLIQKMKLSDGSILWANRINEIISKENIDREENRADMISKNGYDINKSVIDIEKFYLEKGEKNV